MFAFWDSLGQWGICPFALSVQGYKGIWVRGERTASKLRVSLRVDEAAELVRKQVWQGKGTELLGGNRQITKVVSVFVWRAVGRSATLSAQVSQQTSGNG
ncbi:MAG TPA: hypothetical protein DIC52_02480 [Candidatus Latescibacteria bacterium]|nr:hypothetical protein [Candidatus Latescibacterota bacterium]